MRTVLALWLAPGVLFWSWHLLSTNGVVFSRELHDRVLTIYGDLLGMAPGEIPGLFARVLATDGFLILAVVGFRRRRAILAFIHRQWAAFDSRRQPSIETRRSSTP